MKFRPIGKSGIEASVVALGTWGIGGGPNWADTDDALSLIHIWAFAGFHFPSL